MGEELQNAERKILPSGPLEAAALGLMRAGKSIADVAKAIGVKEEVAAAMVERAVVSFCYYSAEVSDQIVASIVIGAAKEAMEVIKEAMCATQVVKRKNDKGEVVEVEQPNISLRLLGLKAWRELKESVGKRPAQNQITINNVLGEGSHSAVSGSYSYESALRSVRDRAARERGEIVAEASNVGGEDNKMIDAESESESEVEGDWTKERIQ